MITIIGRGHSGTRAISHTLSASGVFMGAQLNVSGDMLPPQDLYEACRVMGKYVNHLGGNQWDFSNLHTMPIDPAFTRLVVNYLTQVLDSSELRKGWKLPETTLIYPWIVRMFPHIDYIFWVRDPRDCILGSHITDNLANFGVPYTMPPQINGEDDLLMMRAISWKYQRDIVHATPTPRRRIDVRFEDFVLKQDETLSHLSKYFEFPMAKIEARPDSVGRWKTRADVDFSRFEDLFRKELVEQGYVSKVRMKKAE